MTTTQVICNFTISEHDAMATVNAYEMSSCLGFFFVFFYFLLNGCVHELNIGFCRYRTELPTSRQTFKDGFDLVDAAMTWE